VRDLVVSLLLITYSSQAQEYEKEINAVLIHARYLVNSFHCTVRIPPEILTTVCSYLSIEEDVFSASQVCRYWREVLISSPSLWTRFPCRSISRTITSLERCGSVPIQLEFDPESSIEALRNVLLHGNEINSLTINHDIDWMPPLHNMFTPPIPSAERLHIYSCGIHVHRGEDERRKSDAFWQGLPSLRKLLVCRLDVPIGWFPIPIGQFATPNLVHLALENVVEGQENTTQPILDMLRGSPLLETVLIIHTHPLLQETTLDYSLVSLPYLQSIELGVYEVRSRLITYLQFPPTVAVGFRSLESSDVSGNNIPPDVAASSRHVLGGINVYTVILAVATPRLGGSLRSLVRFEGAGGSLEIIFQLWCMGEALVLFDNDCVLSSFAPHLNNVGELQIAGCYITSLMDPDYIATTMPNLTSINFFHCEYDDEGTMFGLVSGRGRNPWPPFSGLERLTVLEPGPGLIEACQERKMCGTPLRTVVIGPEPSLYTPEQIAELREFVDDVRVEVPHGILEWSVGNRILDTWSGIDIPGLVSTIRRLILPG